MLFPKKCPIFLSFSYYPITIEYFLLKTKSERELIFKQLLWVSILQHYFETHLIWKIQTVIQTFYTIYVKHGSIAYKSHGIIFRPSNTRVGKANSVNI